MVQSTYERAARDAVRHLVKRARNAQGRQRRLLLDQARQMYWHEVDFYFGIVTHKDVSRALQGGCNALWQGCAPFPMRAVLASRFAP